MSVADFQHQIHVLEAARQDSMPHRCSGCGRSSNQVQKPFVSFSSWLFRGAIVDSISGAPLERLDHLLLCSECVVKAALLVDPDQPDGSAAVEEVREGLRHQIAADAKIVAGLRSDARRSERRVAELEKEVAALDHLRSSIPAWGAKLSDAARDFRAARLRAWAAEHAGTGLAEPRAALKEARTSLRALVRTGERLGNECESKRLWPETSLIRERIRTETGEFDGEL